MQFAVDNLSKSYGATRALTEVSLTFTSGEVHALVGENGAGKSTLGKVLAGIVTPDGGSVLVDGRRACFTGPADAREAGIGIILQELDLFPHLSVAENMAAGTVRSSGWLVRRAQMEAQCVPHLRRVGLAIDPRRPLGELPIGHVQLVAIARALMTDARLIVMDEPTSSLATDDADRLLDLIRDLARRGIGIVYVSHKMDEIFRIADRVTVLRDGRHVSTDAAADTDVAQVIARMVGRDLAFEPQAVRPMGSILLETVGLRSAAVAGVDLALHRGEVLGIAGLVGCGRTELGRAIFGLDRITGGTMRLRGEPFAPRSPRDAMRRGIGLLPEDRKLQGLLLGDSVLRNSTITVLGRFSFKGFIRRGPEVRAARAVHERTRLKAASLSAPMRSLSGGNQQKVLLAKWLLAEPDVLFLDEPTRGIDIAAKADIYRLIDELAATGKGVLLVSSELPELLRCSDRILVLHEGRSVGVVDAASTTQEQIMAMATGRKVA
ncbi:MAG TPA: sugar ABC transporter ATP-binding protein [Tepidisphaeraceae bacterium]|jgi:ABC-type sugar transport system ATPase subunit|nr:sugar ABC transporter ATP-binding protein [Tepidisphaeraceae bacterium]